MNFRKLDRRQAQIDALDRGGYDRRQFLTEAATAVLALGLTAPLFSPSRLRASTASCGQDGELTEGPYYLDRAVFRKSVTEGKPGLPLTLRVAILDARTCRPLENAALEIWHCDATGVYSGFTKMGAGGPGGPGGGPGGRPPRPRDSESPGDAGMPGPGSPPDGQPPRPPLDLAGGGFPGMGGPPGFGRHRPKPDDTNFLRGVQLADGQGAVEFDTIYPGWYVGRDTHIHLKVHVGGGTAKEKYQGGHVSHTGQFFFADELSDEVARLAPYSTHHVERTRLDDDMVFADSHGHGPLLTVESRRKDMLSAGLIATAVIHVDPTVTAVEHGPGMRP